MLLFKYMSIIKRTLSETPKKVAFDIDNGDLQAIESVMNRYHFIDEQAMFRFALVALLRAEKLGVYIDEGEQRIFLSPSQSVLKPEAPETSPESSVA